jgi:hypothetical protein
LAYFKNHIEEAWLIGLKDNQKQNRESWQLKKTTEG